MKQRLFSMITGLCLACLHWVATVSAHSPGGDTPPVKRILMIDSYRQEVYWTSALSKRIEASLLVQHPEARVIRGSINADVSVSPSGSTLALRSILWTLTEDTQEAPPATSLEVSSLFANNVAPDVLVFLGDEAFMLYLRYAFQLQHWASVPVVLCAVNESVSSRTWDPQVPDDFTNMESVEHFRYYEKLFSQTQGLSGEPYVHTRPYEVGGVKGYMLNTHLNYTGVKIRVPIRENLELIHRMMPQLKELVWVDDPYYASQYAYKQVREEMNRVMPSVTLSSMLHDRTNIDSIFDVMTQPVEGRAFLTWGLNVDASHSERSEEEVEQLFSEGKGVSPMFTLTPRDFTSNYWLGGCYVSQDEVVDKTIYLIDRVLKGDSARLIPFETVDRSGAILNRSALIREGLNLKADQLGKVTYVNEPLTFYEKYEWQVLVSLLVLSIVAGVLVYLIVQHSYDKRIWKNYERYKRLYDNLQAIYSNSSLDLAFYSPDGYLQLSIVGGQEGVSWRGDREIFAPNLFQTAYLTASQKKSLRRTGSLNCEIKLDEKGHLAEHELAEQKCFHIIVKRMDETSPDDYGYICTVLDLSQLSQDLKDKQRFESLFRFASDTARLGVASYNLETGHRLATDSWHAILAEPGVDTGLPKYRNVLLDDRVLLLEYKQKLLAGEPVDDFAADIRVVTPEGDIRWVRQNYYFLPEHRLLIELSMDIDGQKQAETQLREAKQKAERANEETTKFLADISHEIRTPLNSIVGFSAVLAARDEDSEGFIPIIQRNNKLLMALINNILDLSELDSGQVVFHKEWIDVTALTGEMERYIRANLYGKPLRVSVSLPDTDRRIYTDPLYFHKLSMNILSNAVKFTDTGSISFGYRDESDHYYFYISDTGCGIRQEDMTRIFKRFEKLNAYIQGTGLGLALSKSIVEHLGGEIGVESEWGKGTTFWYTLPKT